MNSVDKNIPLERSFSDIIADYHELTKPGITLAVLASMLVGYVLGSGASFSYLIMINVLIGTYLIASGTGAHNQFIERNLDSLMKRTRNRPLAAHRISPTNGKIFSLSLIFAGLIYLVVFVNPVAAAVSFATTFIYLAIYTPMKRVSAFNIMIGAVPGALPPVGGWAATTGNISDPGMWILFAILFLWQITHVMAIAWFCKDDYAGAGYRMLPKNDISGKKTAFYAILCTVLLFPVSYALYYLKYSGMVYLVLAILLAAFYLYYTLVFAKERTSQNARKLMFASIAYLPLIWAAVFIDRLF
ncbi:MAG: heme o synthase [Balneolaceae bacterium]